MEPCKRLDRHEHPRRLRWAPPNPKVERISLTPADMIVFRAIERHGPLPTPILYEYRKGVFPGYAHFQRRLTELYNGDLRSGPFLTRPNAQFNSLHARHQHIVHNLAPRVRRLLSGESSRLPSSAWFLHQLMQACCGASFELCAPTHGLHYIPRMEVIMHPFGGAAKTADNPMAVPLPGTSKKLMPDDLFALGNERGMRFFIVEIDRATESMMPSDIDLNFMGKKTTYFRAKVENYVSLLRAKTLKQWWGFEKPHILIITSNKARAENILRYLSNLDDPALTGRFYIKVETALGSEWRVPRAVFSNLLDEPWRTPAGVVDIKP